MFKVSTFRVEYSAISKISVSENRTVYNRKYWELPSTFFVLDLSLDIVDGVAALDLESNGLPC